MKKFVQYLSEKLIINKNFKKIGEDIGVWKHVSDRNGFIHYVSPDNQTSLFDYMFSDIVNVYKKIQEKYAVNLISQNKYVLTTWVNKDNHFNYIVFGYSKKIFGGYFALWFFDGKQNTSNNYYVSLTVHYGDEFKDILNEIENNSIEERLNFKISDDEFEKILDVYLKIEESVEQ